MFLWKDKVVWFVNLSGESVLNVFNQAASIEITKLRLAGRFLALRRIDAYSRRDINHGFGVENSVSVSFPDFTRRVLEKITWTF